jgi:hypothetical protein
VAYWSRPLKKSPFHLGMLQLILGYSSYTEVYPRFDSLIDGVLGEHFLLGNSDVQDIVPVETVLQPRM